MLDGPQTRQYEVLQVFRISLTLAGVQRLVFLLKWNIPQSSPRLEHLTPHMALLPTSTAPRGFCRDCQPLTLHSDNKINTQSW